jgi:hypothetical protein
MEQKNNNLSIFNFNMKKLLLNIMLFCALFFMVDKLFYVVIYLSPKYQVDNRLELILNGKINKDIIILGSSRGATNIIASQVEKQTNLTAYNISYYGSNVEFHEFILKTLLKFNKKPRIIIFAVDDPAELLPNNTINYRLDYLYPYVNYNYINQELINKGDRDFTSWFMFLTRLNRNNFKFNKKRTKYNNILPCGSMPLNLENSKINLTYDKTIPLYSIKKESSSKKAYFKTIIELCAKNKIQLIFTFPPNFREHNKHFENRIRQLSFSGNNFFVYDTLNIKYKNKDYFYDESHLNLKGAKLFTGELSKFINRNK